MALQAVGPARTRSVQRPKATLGALLTGALLSGALLAGCATPVQPSAPATEPTGSTSLSPPSGAQSSAAPSAPGTPTTATNPTSNHPPSPSGASRSTTPPLPATGSPTVASGPSGAGNGSVSSRIAGIEPVLTALATAASRRDQSVWGAQVSQKDLGFVATAGMVYRNLATLRPTSLDFTPTSQQRSLSPTRQKVLGSDAFAAQVLISWRLSGEVQASEHLVWMSFVPAGASGWRWAGSDDEPIQADPAALPLWWLEPITVSRSHGNTVLAGSGTDGSVWLARADRATTDVTKQLKASSRGVASPDQGWNGRVVIEVPSTQAQFEQIVGAAPGSDSQLAALTYPDAMDARTAPMRIMLNPQVMAQESELGIGIVLTHECTHVATRSPASVSPLWLIEGFADYNAYASYPQGQASARAGLYSLVRRSGAPSAPPGNERFNPQAQQLDLAYAEAWQLCVYLASHGGHGKLNAFYASVSRSPDADVPAALHDIYGIDRSELIKRWDAWLTSAAQN